MDGGGWDGLGRYVHSDRYKDNMYIMCVLIRISLPALTDLSVSHPYDPDSGVLS